MQCGPATSGKQLLIQVGDDRCRSRGPLPLWSCRSECINIIHIPMPHVHHSVEINIGIKLPCISLESRYSITRGPNPSPTPYYFQVAESTATIAPQLMTPRTHRTHRWRDSSLSSPGTGITNSSWLQPLSGRSDLQLDRHHLVTECPQSFQPSV